MYSVILYFCQIFFSCVLAQQRGGAGLHRKVEFVHKYAIIEPRAKAPYVCLVVIWLVVLFDTLQ